MELGKAKLTGADHRCSFVAMSSYWVENVHTFIRWPSAAQRDAYPLLIRRLRKGLKHYCSLLCSAHSSTTIVSLKDFRNLENGVKCATNEELEIEECSGSRNLAFHPERKTGQALCCRTSKFELFLPRPIRFHRVRSSQVDKISDC